MIVNPFSKKIHVSLTFDPASNQVTVECKQPFPPLGVVGILIAGAQATVAKIAQMESMLVGQNNKPIGENFDAQENNDQDRGSNSGSNGGTTGNDN